MKVAIFGGTGFVGSYIVDELLEQGHVPVMLVRLGSEDKVRRRDMCELVSGVISNPDAVRRTVTGTGAVIYNIGILKEIPNLGITFEALQFEGARLVMDKALEAGVKRFLLMSANGVKADGTAYQKTKYMAEQYLQASGLNWTIFRPSVVFGDPRGRMEFATQLYRDIVASPLPAPMFYDGFLPFGAGTMEMSPIHVGDVAKIFVESLKADKGIGQIYHLGGSRNLSWKQILQTIGEATGKRVFGLPTPAWAVKIVAGLLDGLNILPVTRDQISMLVEGNTCDSTEVFREFDIDPVPFDAGHLQYLKNAP